MRISSLPEPVKRISTTPVNLFILHELGIEMSKIKSELEIITAFAHNSHLDDAAPSVVLSCFSNIEDMRLVGYEAPQKHIVEKLLDISIPQRLEITILGPEAAGKSTLAQCIYQSIAEKNHFDVCFWLFDMNHFDYKYPQLFKPIDILRKMLMKLEPGNSLDDYDEEHLILKICMSLKLKRYLVVIDNIQRYNVFRKALPDENNGSRVLIATQEAGKYERICLDFDPQLKYELPSLTENERLKLIFNKKIESLKDLEDFPSDVLGEARRIAARWGDSPMNLVLLGGHLLFNQPVSHNRKVLRDIADAATFGEFLSSIYYKLPSVLQTCFSYMAAVFPVNYLIHSTSLIRLWVAEGIIPKEHGRTIEQTAELCLDQLIQRGFVHVIWAYYHNQANKPSHIVLIHPMLQSGLLDNDTGINSWAPIKVILGDDALDISGCYGEPDVNHANCESWHRLALHSSYDSDQFSSFHDGKMLHGLKYPSLHSLFFFGFVAPLMFSEFRFLRVLSVFHARIRFCKEDTPCWLDGLINLRYLGFIVCWVESGSLGKKLSRLTNLQTLDLSESSVSGLSEFREHNPKLNVIDPIKGELQAFWSPLPDLYQ
ncbi:Disease resistance protein RPP8 [Rhynchospora pubera]|nr:Disease resistance protein RPP8 [Rhynchospora pubera]